MGRFARDRAGLLLVIVGVTFSLVALAAGLAYADQRPATLVQDINPNGDVDAHASGLTYFTVITDTLYFVATDGDGDAELWKSDGTMTGTVRVKDIAPGVDTLTPGDLVNFNGVLFFRGNEGTNGEELWVSDGTDSGTMMFADINSAGDANPFRFQVLDDLLFFSADDGTTGRELWKSDGTMVGTVRVRDINGGSAGSFPSQLTVSGGSLFFVADDGISGVELWKSDGTMAGTVRVRNINPGGGSEPRDLVDLNGTLFFTADDGTNGRELWKSDGTMTGTVMVADIHPDPAAFGPDQLTSVGDHVFFSADDGVSGAELWKSDGVEAGTAPVRDIVPGSGSSIPSNLTAVSGILYFTAIDGAHGRELWKSDGSEAGTVLVEDINPGSERSFASKLVDVDGTLFFRADDGASGNELWKSDGTDETTFLVADVNDGGDSLPDSLTALGTGLMFTADDGVVGRELWFVDLTNQTPTTGAGGPYAGDEGTAIALSGTANDPDSDTLLIGWTINTSLCAFSDPSVLSSDLTCDDDGTFTATLTVTDSWGATAGSATQVTVGNVAPTVDQPVVSGDPIQIESTVTITATYSDPGAADTHTYEIEWGDGAVDSGTAAGGQIVAGHEYADEDVYTVTVTVTDDDGGVGSAMTTVDVLENEAPSAGAGGPYAGDEGAAVALSGTAADPDGDPLQIGWTVDAAVCALSDATALDPELTCDDDGTFTATLTVTDTWGATAVNTAQVTVSNVAPTINALEVPAEPVVIAETVTISVTYGDPGAADTHTFEIAWGDGTVDSGMAAGGQVVAGHQYADQGDYTITVTVMDDDGDVDDATASVAVVPFKTLLPVVWKP